MEVRLHFAKYRS